MTPADTDTDEALLRLLSFDLDAGFTKLIQSYEVTLYSIALRFCGRSADAEDLAAEAFLRAYSALRSYEQERLAELRLRSWLVTIQLNVCRNWLRTKMRRPDDVTFAEDSQTYSEPPAIGADVEPQAELAETSRELADLLNCLPTTQRAAVILRHIAGMPVDEIAEVLGCPSGTVKSHVSRGLNKLRTLAASEGVHGNERIS